MKRLRLLRLLTTISVVLFEASCAPINANSSDANQPEDISSNLIESSRNCPITFKPTNVDEILRFYELIAKTQNNNQCDAPWLPVVREDINKALNRKDFNTAGYLAQEMLKICPENVAERHPGYAHHILFEKLGDSHRGIGLKVKAQGSINIECAIQYYENSKWLAERRSRNDPYLHAEDVVFKLAPLYSIKGDLWAAERLYINIINRNKGNVDLIYHHQVEVNSLEGPYKAFLKVLDSLIAVAQIYSDLGLYPEAEKRFKEAEDLILGAEQRLLEATAFERNNKLSQIHLLLAFVYKEQGNYSESQNQFKKALDLIQQIQTNNLQADSALLNSRRGLIYLTMNQIDNSIEFLEKAKKKFENTQNLNLSIAYINLGTAYWFKGNYRKAVDYYKKAEQTTPDLISHHQRIGRLFFKHAIVAWFLGDKESALNYMERWQDIVQRELQMGLKGGTEKHKVAFLASRKIELDGMISLQQKFAKDDELAAELALQSVLNIKGRVIDAMTLANQNWRFYKDVMCPLARQSEYKNTFIEWLACPFLDDDSPDKLFSQLAAIRHQLMAIKQNEKNPVSLASIDSNDKTLLEKKLEELETRLSFNTSDQLAPISTADIQTLIPGNGTLIEFIQYRKYNPEWKRPEEEWGEKYYLAFVVHKEGPPKAVPLGPSKEIDDLILRLRDRIEGRSALVKSTSRELYAKVIGPLQNALGDSEILLIAPDGQLNLLPFGALINKYDRFLVQDFLISYLNSGRELLKLKSKENKRSNPIVFADPRFDLNIKKDSKDSDQSCAKDDSPDETVYRSTEAFNRLPCTAVEAREISNAYGDFTLMLGENAVKTALFNIEGPEILHLSTHGFYDPPIELDEDDSTSRIDINNSLLQSGIALAGANSPKDDQGIVTAFEMASLDLKGTKLAVLSACNSGRGYLAGRENVFGMPRSLSIAGAETVVMSLWKVPEVATKDLMTEFYRELKAKKGRSEALRQAQCKLMQNNDTGAPYFWASFISSGDWRNMQNERITSVEKCN